MKYLTYIFIAGSMLSVFACSTNTESIDPADKVSLVKEVDSKTNTPQGPGMPMAPGQPPQQIGANQNIFAIEEPRLKGCLIQILGEQRYYQLRTVQPTQQEMYLIGPCMPLVQSAGMPGGTQPPQGPGMPMAPTSLPKPVDTKVVDGYDYRLDDANILNHLSPNNELCIFHSLGEVTFRALRTRPMNQEETDQVMHCFGSRGEDGKMLASPQLAGDVWEGPTICTSHGVFYQPPAFGVALGQPIADPTAIVLDDGRIRLYAFAQEIGIVSAVSDDGRVFVEESGIRIPGTEAGQPRVWRLPDGRWRMYVSKVKEIVSFTSDDGLDFIKDPGDRLTAQAAGLPAISSPSIVEVEPGLWRMYYSTLAAPGTGPGGKRSGSATSTDLLEWTVDPGWRLGEGAQYLTDSAEHPFPVIAADGSVSLFYGKFRASQDGAPDGLWRATSVDGLTFTDEAYTGLYFGNDPEVLLLPSGERIIYYGNFDPAIGGQLLSAACTEW